MATCLGLGGVAVELWPGGGDVEVDGEGGEGVVGGDCLLKT